MSLSFPLCGVLMDFLYLYLQIYAVSITIRIVVSSHLKISTWGWFSLSKESNVSNEITFLVIDIPLSVLHTFSSSVSCSLL